MKTNKIVYYAATGLLTALMCMSAGMYFLKHEEITMAFTALGYPTYLIYPIAIAKLLGLVAVWTRASNTLKEWAYAGFFFDFVLAAAAHMAISDGQSGLAIGGIVILVTSYIFEKRTFGGAF